ncbi:DUF4333 domain-containing protein [Mycobacterium avium]|uniref:DUF4333 domain-containing protein n=1 Tax=Mycobacterium avium TaxID=1764 RepID=UPI0011536E91|nr:DUF4333 domain-containing protein [Mycobacterium avium]
MGNTDDFSRPEYGGEEETTLISPPDSETTVVVPPKGGPDPDKTVVINPASETASEETTVVVPAPASATSASPLKPPSVPSPATTDPAEQTRPATWPAPAPPAPPADQTFTPRPPASTPLPPASAPLLPRPASPMPTYPPPGYAPIRPYLPSPAPSPYAGPAATTPEPQRRFDWRLLIPLVVGAVIVSVALVAVVIVRAGPVKSLLADNLDVAATQAAVQGVLTDSTTGYGLHDVKDVTCNNGVNPVIAKGATFTCEFTIDGHQLQAKMTFLDSAGTYSVGRPQ